MNLYTWLFVASFVLLWMALCARVGNRCPHRYVIPVRIGRYMRLMCVRCKEPTSDPFDLEN